MPLTNTPDKMDPAQLLDVLKEPLQKLIKSDVDQDADPEKIHQYLQARRAHLYFDGKQDLAYTFEGDTIDFTSVGSPLSDLANTEDSGVYNYHLNVVKGDGRKFAAVLGNRAPNVKAVANDEEDERSVGNARRADAVARLLYSWWEVKEMVRHVALLFWKAGTVFAYLPYNADKYKYGSTQEPEFELKEQVLAPEGVECQQCGNRMGMQEASQMGLQCPACGAPLSFSDYRPPETAQVPVQTGMREYANGRVECHIFTVLYVTVPFYSKKLDEASWLKLETEEHKGKILRKHPQLREKLSQSEESSGGQSSAATLGQTTRQALSSPTGTWFRRKNLVSYKRIWIRPEMYELLESEEVRGMLQQNFPEGAKITLVNDEMVDLEHERIEWVWTVGKPETSDFIYADPLAKDHIDIQDVINVLLNIGIETMERAIPWMLADPDVIDFDQLTTRSRRPMEVVPAKAGAGKDVRDAVKESPMAKFSEQMMPFSASVLENSREVVGVQKAIFGGETGVETTAREYEGKRNQAMMQLSTSWDELRFFLARTLKAGAQQLARYGPKQMKAPTQDEKSQALVELEGLVEDDWHYEVEETIPITPGQRADRLLYLLEKGPTAADLLQLLHPENQRLLTDLLGLTGLKNPQVDQVEAVKETIRELLQTGPVQAIDPMTGQPRMQPSVEPKWEEDSNLVVAAVKAWAISIQGRRAEKENPQGYMNVIAYGAAHEKKFMEQQMAMAGPMPQAGAPAPPPGDKPMEPLLPGGGAPLPPRPVDATM